MFLGIFVAGQRIPTPIANSIFIALRWTMAFCIFVSEWWAYLLGFSYVIIRVINYATGFVINHVIIQIPFILLFPLANLGIRNTNFLCNFNKRYFAATIFPYFKSFISFGTSPSRHLQGHHLPARYRHYFSTPVTRLPFFPLGSVGG
ncbi:hypothetical protein SpAn4DRAFT_0615 [Sporomusa ovata]|uniref:Uncharacterized protein n=1 Tax=Sporomusa ovata TaxID=2378 RepID=A0A0U1L4X0_9FIRM|nr:hypothetical protein SpAn4DRAFT_0615 [Sporomusa ovata]